MRRSLSIAVLTAVVGAALSVVTPATAEPGTPAVVPSGTEVRTTLGRAEAALAGDAAPGLSPTLALREVFLALPTLTGDDRERALAVLARPDARPTQGPQDPQGDGYTVPSKKDCSTKICMHWVPRTADAPPKRSWVGKTLTVMKKTWAHEVGKLGYRHPVTDGDRGGNSKFDVYLKDVGAQGYYGYCVPERATKGSKWVASGYCVLDNDFARSQFGAKPMAALRVTAAHEFFHAIQYSYDYAEDRWLLESTATWMEERVADDVDDNRQYLDRGQLVQPHEPLDLYVQGAFNQYGNWVFFEYLSHQFGNDVVRKVWRQAAAYKGAPDRYSTAAVKAALPKGKTFADVFRSYAVGNTIPGRTYPEGESWPSADMAASHDLSPADPTAQGRLGIDHMASKNVVVRPGAKLDSRDWALRVRVDGPARSATPRAYVVVHKTGGAIVRKPLRLDRDGRGGTTFRFDAASVRKATLTLVNASTKFNCWEQTVSYSCQGNPKQDGKKFGYTLRTFQR